MSRRQYSSAWHIFKFNRPVHCGPKRLANVQPEERQTNGRYCGRRSTETHNPRSRRPESFSQCKERDEVTWRCHSDCLCTISVAYLLVVFGKRKTAHRSLELFSRKPMLGSMYCYGKGQLIHSHKTAIRSHTHRDK